MKLILYCLYSFTAQLGLSYATLASYLCKPLGNYDIHGHSRLIPTWLKGFHLAALLI